MDDTTLEFDDNQRLMELCGAHDRHLAMVEEGFGITITRRGNVLGLHGERAARDLAAQALNKLYARIEAGRRVEAGDVDAAVRLSTKAELPAGDDALEIKTKRKRVEPRTGGAEEIRPRSSGQ